MQIRRRWREVWQALEGTATRLLSQSARHQRHGDPPKVGPAEAAQRNDRQRQVHSGRRWRQAGVTAGDQELPRCQPCHPNGAAEWLRSSKAHSQIRCHLQCINLQGKALHVVTVCSIAAVTIVLPRPQNVPIGCIRALAGGCLSSGLLCGPVTLLCWGSLAPTHGLCRPLSRRY